MWGIIGRKYLPIDFEKEVNLTARQGAYYQRQLLHLQRKKRSYWMHSESTHTSRQSMGKPVKWRRVRSQMAWSPDQVEPVLSDEQMAAVYCDGPRPSSVVLDLPQQLANFKNWGFKVKRVVPTCCRRKAVVLWSVDEDSGKLEKHGEEMNSFSSGWHHLKSAEAKKLLLYVLKNVR